MSLYISVTTPTADFSESPLEKAITFFAASIAMDKRLGKFPGGPKLDITFMITSQIHAPEFEGMRMGGYDKENQTLYFDTAVPMHLTQSAMARRYVQAVLLDAVENARDYFDELGISFAVDQWNHLINELGNAGYANHVTH